MPAGLAGRAPWIAASLAAFASLPGLRMPFLSDDWAQIDAVAGGPVPRTPFGDFRPLYMATLWLDRTLAGLSPSFFHLTNLLLIAAAAALVVIVVRRHTGDPGLSLATGLLLALHPYHVENAAWIAARSDSMYAVFFLLSLLFYDRWRDRASGLPLLACLSYEAALLSKESALTLPLVLLAIAFLVPNRRPGAFEWRRGYAPLFALTAAHFLALRPWFLGGMGRTLLEGFGAGWVKNGLGLTAAAILPFDVETLAAHPFVFGALAVIFLSALLAIARSGSDRVPSAAWGAAGIFSILLLPCIVGFQERYLFLPVAASSLFLAAIVRAARGRRAVLLLCLIAAGWTLGACEQWAGWRDAAVASRRLVADLVRISLETRSREIVIANAPFRVHGSSVAGDLRSAVRLSGGRAVPVRASIYVSCPSPDTDLLDGPPDVSIRRPPPEAEVRLRVVEGPFSHVVGRRPAQGNVFVEAEGSVTFEAEGRVVVRILPEDERGRSAYAWTGGRLVPLFVATK